MNPMPISQTSVPLGRMLAIALFAALVACNARAEDGYRLWLRYDRIEDPRARAAYAGAASRIVLSTESGAESPIIGAARDELVAGLAGMLDVPASVALEASPRREAALGDEGYSISRRGEPCKRVPSGTASSAKRMPSASLKSVMGSAHW